VRISWLNSQFHHRMNFPHGVVRHVFATVALIFRCMAYVPVRFPNNCNDRRFTEGQLLRSASVKRKPCWSPTKNCCANLTPLRSVLQTNAVIMSVVGYFIPVCSYHFVIAVWRAKCC
jgi:hypothetical protein